MQKSVLYITQTFPPEPGATSRPLYQSIYLKELGYDVTILTTMPNYPVGKIHKNYRGKLFKKEIKSGILIHRVWSLPAQGNGFIIRAISHLSFAFFACIYGVFIKRHDFVISSVPNIGTEMTGFLIGKVKSSITILEQRDVIPENLEFIGVSKKSLMYRLLYKYYDLINKILQVIVVPGKSMKKILIDKGVESSKIIVLPHGTEANRQEPEETDLLLLNEFNIKNKFIVLYSGSFNAYYDVVNYVQAAQIIQNENDSIRFVLIGQGADYSKVKHLIKKLGLKNVVLTGALEHKKIKGLQRKAHIFLSTLYTPTYTPLTMYDYLNTKVTEYLMVGKPVITIESGKILGRIITKHQMGAVLSPKEPKLLASTILNYYQNESLRISQGKNARKYALENHDRRLLMKNFVMELKKITEAKSI